jgi:peptide chain release factor 1
LSLRDLLGESLARAAEVERLLSNPDTFGEPQKAAELGREHRRLQPVVVLAAELDRTENELAGARELVLVDDPEMSAAAAEEVVSLVAMVADIEVRLKPALLPHDPLDDRNAIIEIRSGAGGDEAALFAADLFRLYTRFIDRSGWRLEMMSHADGTLGGVKEAVFKVTGAGAFGAMRHESGIHRVQRVPATETQGRIHTSAATVAVLPEAEEVDVRIEDKDLRIDVFRSSGPGGQSVNTTDSAVRITHLPSGLVVSQQDQKSQLQNKLKAMEVLRARLLDLRVSEAEAARSKMRKSQVGTGDRSGKIRTYNYPQSRITDHRIGWSTHDLSSFMDGRIDDLVSALKLADVEDQLGE